MTEYELIEVAYLHYGAMSNSAVMYLSLVTAYLVAGYIVAGKLTTTQYVIVNSLFIVWVLTTVNAIHQEMQGALAIAAELARLGSIHGYTLNPGVVSASVYAFITVQVSGLLASLYFVWSVRHPARKKARPA